MTTHLYRRNPIERSKRHRFVRNLWELPQETMNPKLGQLTRSEVNSVFFFRIIDHKPLVIDFSRKGVIAIGIKVMTRTWNSLLLPSLLICRVCRIGHTPILCVQPGPTAFAVAPGMTQSTSTGCIMQRTPGLIFGEEQERNWEALLSSEKVCAFPFGKPLGKNCNCYFFSRPNLFKMFFKHVKKQFTISYHDICR